MKKMNNKGFSLVELIIVIAIMAILAGALAPALIKYIAKSRRSTDVNNAGSIQSAMNNAFQDEAAAEVAPDSGASGEFGTNATPALPGNDAYWNAVSEDLQGGVLKVKSTKNAEGTKLTTPVFEYKIGDNDTVSIYIKSGSDEYQCVPTDEFTNKATAAN